MKGKDDEYENGNDDECGKRTYDQCSSDGEMPACQED